VGNTINHLENYGVFASLLPHASDHPVCGLQCTSIPRLIERRKKLLESEYSFKLVFGRVYQAFYVYITY
jgi:hypothetical protein